MWGAEGRIPGLDLAVIFHTLPYVFTNSEQPSLLTAENTAPRSKAERQIQELTLITALRTDGLEVLA